MNGFFTLKKEGTDMPIIIELSPKRTNLAGNKIEFCGLERFEVIQEYHFRDLIPIQNFHEIFRGCGARIEFLIDIDHVLIRPVKMPVSKLNGNVLRDGEQHNVKVESENVLHISEEELRFNVTDCNARNCDRDLCPH